MDTTESSFTENHDVEEAFGWIDFTLFGTMIVSSAIIGIYFGTCGKKDDSQNEYLHGGKSMNSFPVAASLISSTISTVVVIGFPAEVYQYGTTYWWYLVSIIFATVVNYYFFLPVFYELQLTSIYEYLEMRFNRSVRLVASVLCTICALLYVPLVIYVPSVVVSQVSGLHIHLVCPVISVVCIIYTMLGGLKAVVWTDFIQGGVMLASTLAVLIIGLVHVGGFTTVLERSWNGGRIIFFDADPSPTKRTTVWSVVIGKFFLWLTFLTEQGTIQKFMSLSTMSKARRTQILQSCGILIFNSITFFIGLLMYSTYHDCDPLQSKGLRSDQLVTHYVMDVTRPVPGIAGLFVAGVLSAGLSTVSSRLNSLAATVYEDFVRPCIRKDISERMASNIMKLVVVTFGAIFVGMIFIIEKMEGIINIASSLMGVSGGAVLGLFSFGLFIPRGNSKGALVGSITSLLFMAWMVFGTQKAMSDGRFRHPTLPSSTNGCNVNETGVNSQLEKKSYEEDVFILFKLSFLYYCMLGTFIMIVVGIIVSVFTEPPKLHEMNPALFSPVVRKYVTKRTGRYDVCTQAEMEELNSKS